MIDDRIGRRFLLRRCVGRLCHWVASRWAIPRRFGQRRIGIVNADIGPFGAAVDQQQIHPAAVMAVSGAGDDLHCGGITQQQQMGQQR